MVVVATQPLTDNEPWRAFTPGELRLFVDGASVWQQVLPFPTGVAATATAVRAVAR
jgi:hypothetical protein